MEKMQSNIDRLHDDMSDYQFALEREDIECE